MTVCKDVYAFLVGVRNRSVTTTLPDADVTTLQQLGIVKVVTAAEYAQITRDLAGLGTDRDAIAQEIEDRNRLAAQLWEEKKRTHSILFHLEGRERRQAQMDAEAADTGKVQAEESDLAARQQRFDALIAARSMMDTLAPYGGRYVGLTGFGAMQWRDLGLRLYRASDLDFSAYWQQAQQVARELNGIAARSAEYVAQLSRPLSTSDRSYLWAIGVGLAKTQADVTQGASAFVAAYASIGGLAHNDENRLMSAEILTNLPRPIGDTLPWLTRLEKDVRGVGVPKPSALGVASILLLGQRQDGTFATAELQSFLRLTRSFESAALLAIVNRPFDELAGKFSALRSLFASWGYQPSEDMELAASYLTLSDLPADGISTKLTILTRGLQTYLEYPLVAASILASIPVFEANETLNLLEEAYEIIGRLAMPMSQAELICLAVRMIHGIRNETVSGLDSTAAAARTPVGFTYRPGMGFFFVPIIVLHGSYYSTFGGLAGAHPGHVHAFGGSVG
jgi:hypothetical protein